MNIQFHNGDWVMVEKTEEGYTLGGNDRNGNTFEIYGITEKYLKQMLKDIEGLRK